MQQQQQQGEPPTDPRQHTGSRHKLLIPAPTSSTTSTGPCRTDLSGQLVVIQQVLSGNTADHSNSTASQLLLQPYSGQHAAAAAAAPGSDCSHGTQPAAGAGASAPAATSIQQQQQQDQPMSRKRGRPSCQYGNYHHYYGYRLKPSGFEDPRLKVCGARRLAHELIASGGSSSGSGASGGSRGC
jgi:hypothetical protein